MAAYAPVYRKPDSECAPITLIMRKYYTAERTQKATERRRENKEAINNKLRERYHNDPEFREAVLVRTRASYHRRKAKLLAN